MNSVSDIYSKWVGRDIHESTVNLLLLALIKELIMQNDIDISSLTQLPKKDRVFKEVGAEFFDDMIEYLTSRPIEVE